MAPAMRPEGIPSFPISLLASPCSGFDQTGLSTPFKKSCSLICTSEDWYVLGSGLRTVDAPSHVILPTIPVGRSHYVTSLPIFPYLLNTNRYLLFYRRRNQD